MSRHFVPISIADLTAKIDVFTQESVDDDDYEGCLYSLIEHLGSDIKVDFDLENVSYSSGDFGPEGLMGYHTLPNGFTFCGMCAGGDWEQPIFFCVYWDGKKLRGYVPKKGNPWNVTTKAAYGNDDGEDLKDARKRWPDKFGSGVTYLCMSQLDFDPVLITEDICARILLKV